MGVTSEETTPLGADMYPPSSYGVAVNVSLGSIGDGHGNAGINDASVILGEDDPFKWDLKRTAGTARFIDDIKANATDANGNPIPMMPLDTSKHAKLSQWPATAICGNDITSSCLYVIGLCAYYAGIWAPLSLALVGVLLFLFRSIYTEVGSALPLNGASYTLLLNTTSKTVSSLAACLTLISYVATAVVSGSDAIAYVFNGILPNIPVLDRIPPKWAMLATILLLAFFAILSIIGITESAVTALIIFVTHLATLVMLIICCLIFTIKNKGQILRDNWYVPAEHNIAYSIFFGFAAAMLGITGFESSANFIEQQKDGVFPKTLRNMWFCVAVLNPTISFFSLAVLPLSVVRDPANQEDVLSLMGAHAAGKWLQIFVSVDAALVLSGGVLTSYVGVTGLVRRMSLDRCLPQFFLRTNKLRKTNHWIIITFFLICSSMYLILGNTIANLAGVYTIAFLSVMFLFAFGDLILKYKRSRLPRQTRAPKTFIFVAAFGVACALVGNILANPEYFKWFAIYYGCTALLVIFIVLRITIIKIVIYFVYSKLKSWKLHDKPFTKKLMRFLQNQARKINAQSMIFLAKDDNISLLNKAILYIRNNEQTDWIQFVHVYEDESKIPERLVENVALLDRIYPKIRMDFVGIKGEFGPEMVDHISYVLGVPKNLIFISCPSERFQHNLADLGGLRIITTE
eukprot:GEZU01002898.1.p1 GENE.GEZU01002898.1~~GEZU01002898.1.p1  ORF type:complete len:687 (+),score=186.79 GEZU01002898.1:773-2833(+)